MHFDFGQKRYVVSIAGRPLMMGGQACRAKVDHVHCKIWISDQLPKHERRRLLFHELRHGWIDLHGRAQTVEADADDVAAMMDDVLEQYMNQGGDAVLEKLNPDPEPVQGRQSPAMARTDFECGECRAKTMIGSVVNEKPVWSADFGAWVICRWIDCEVCNTVTVWHESATAEGTPRGELIAHPQPKVLRGREAGLWRREHESVAV